MRTPRLRRLAFVVVATALLTEPAAAQFRGGGAAFQVRRRLAYQGSTQTQSGMWVGGEGSFRFGPLVVAGGGLMGKLTPDSAGVGSEADVQSSWARVGLRAGAWVTVAVQVEARRLKLAAGEQLRRSIGGAVIVTPPLGIPGLSALADVGFFPSAQVTNGPKIGVALQTTFGVVFSPPSAPVFLQLSYRFERFDIDAPTGGEPRYEEFGGLYVTGGVRLGR